MTVVATTLPSGSRVTITLTDDVSVLTSFTTVKYASGGDVRGFHISNRGYFERVLEDFHPSVLKSRGVFRNFEFLVGVGRDGKTTTACARGQNFDITTVYGGPALSSNAAQSRFASFDFDEGSDGVSVRPRAGQNFTSYFEDATVVIGGLGILMATVGDVALARLPDWEGTPTKYGEVWKRQLELEADVPTQYEYLMGFPNVAATIVTGAYGDDTTTDWANRLNELNAEAS